MRRLLALGISGAIATLAVALIVASGTMSSTATASATQVAASDVQLTAGFNMVTYAGPTLPVEEALAVALGANVDAASGVFSFNATTQQWETWSAGAPSFVNSLGALQTDRPYFIRATRAALWSSAASDPSPSPFVGAWHTIDGDGSNIWVFISHEIDDLFLVRWYEDGGSICNTDPLSPILVEFTAQQNGNTLSGSFGRAWCQFDEWTQIPPFEASAIFEYDEQADTITNWQRSDATWPAVASGTTSSTTTASATQAAASDVQLTAGFNMVTYAGPTLPVEEALLVALGANQGAADGVFSFNAATQQWQTWSAGVPSFVNTLEALETGRPYFIRATRAALWGSAASDPSPSPFVGAWHTVDVDGDGSNQWVFISHEIDDLFLVRWYEDGSGGCDPDTLPPILLEFTAQLNGNTLSGGTGQAWCQFDGWTEIPGPNVSSTLEYDEQADTIITGQGTWQRSDATWPVVALSAR